ncbi:DUF481 domain-containing protein [Saccharicrinis aurantiacus]|uniref:DUF481 domain-containing protein n=1 Tax=Saccharicrinis aurantiacus TaxID=1849719 RepID=UPI0024939A4F|nr:DUF481 domain-containing protein [Saccharicrinis aurantiacus]
MKLNIFLSFIFMGLCISLSAFSQNDSLVFNNGNYIVGEIKEMNRGVIQVETDYSDSDFKIEWDGISQIHSDAYYLFTLADGTRLTGGFTSQGDKTIVINDVEQGAVIVQAEDIVWIKSIETDFWSKMSANIDLGFSYTKAKNAQQFNVRSNLGYLTDNYSLTGKYDQVISTQDSTEKIQRTDGIIGYNYFLPRAYFLLGEVNLSSNNELNLKLRSVGKLGLGKYLVQTNLLYWSLNLGLAYNNEEFTNDDPVRKSMDAFLGTEFNMFNTGDISFLTGAILYPSLTESGRIRSDFKFDLKLDLPRDFYIKLGTTINYDNEPATDALTTDYVIQSGIGWEL